MIKWWLKNITDENILRILNEPQRVYNEDTLPLWFRGLSETRVFDELYILQLQFSSNYQLCLYELFEIEQQRFSLKLLEPNVMSQRISIV